MVTNGRPRHFSTRLPTWSPMGDHDYTSWPDYRNGHASPIDCLPCYWAVLHSLLSMTRRHCPGTDTTHWPRLKIMTTCSAQYDINWGNSTPVSTSFIDTLHHYSQAPCCSKFYRLQTTISAPNMCHSHGTWPSKFTSQTLPEIITTSSIFHTILLSNRPALYSLQFRLTKPATLAIIYMDGDGWRIPTHLDQSWQPAEMADPKQNPGLYRDPPTLTR
jgi:hypothetical protein